jgi:hypothetical protein
MCPNSNQMLQLPGKHIGFVFSDRAGANACIALAKICEKEKKIRASLFSNKPYSEVDGLFFLTDIAPSFRALGIDCVFTGTSHPESSNYFEVNCIRKAVSENIYTISFIDHWVNFKLRFAGLEISEYPHEIWVVDEVAKQLAIKDDLPGEKLFVRGNPYHYYLKNYWQPQYSNKNYFDKLQVPTTGFHILFAPDPISLRDGNKITGFDEAEALNDLLLTTSQWEDVRLVVKCHPLQPVDKLLDIIKRNDSQNCFLIREADTLELIQASDLVVGFYSNLLLEAEMLGKRVVRYFPGNPEADLLKHKESLKKIRDINELMDEIKLSMYE